MDEEKWIYSHLPEHGVNRHALQQHFVSMRLYGFQAINHKNFPISKHFKIRGVWNQINLGFYTQVPIFLTRDKHAVLVKSFQREPTENLLSYKDHLCLFPAFTEDYTERSMQVSILL